MKLGNYQRELTALGLAYFVLAAAGASLRISILMSQLIFLAGKADAGSSRTRKTQLF
jgi:hypothetical protein